MQPSSLPQSAARLRHFNRFYTRQIGLFDRAIPGSGFSLAEARVLYELAHHDQVTATDFIWKFGMDGGYLSRMLRGFEKEGLLEKHTSPTDRRVSYLKLTKKGHTVFASLDRTSQSVAETLLKALPEPGQQRLLAAMQDIEALLGEKEGEPITFRPHRTGDMGWIVHRQSVLYAQEYGWDNSYEALISDIAATFIRDFKPDREAAWIAERGAQILGAVFVVEKEPGIAQLRMLYVEPEARGAGLGRRLVDECVAFARARGYRRLELWTNDILVAARRIYEAAGFTLVGEEKHHSFGCDLTGQTWALELEPPAL